MLSSIKHLFQQFEGYVVQHKPSVLAIWGKFCSEQTICLTNGIFPIILIDSSSKVYFLNWKVKESSSHQKSNPLKNKTELYQTFYLETRVIAKICRAKFLERTVRLLFLSSTISEIGKHSCSRTSSKWYDQGEMAGYISYVLDWLQRRIGKIQFWKSRIW